MSGEDASCGEGDAYEVEIVIAAFVVVSDSGRSREEVNGGVLGANGRGRLTVASDT